MLLRDLHRWTVRARSAFICHKAACVPGSQPRPGSIIARSTAHRPETRRNRAHFAARTRRNFLSFHEGAIAEVRMQAISPLADFSFDYHDLLFRPVQKR